MTRIIVETAALADAIKKADRIAPSSAGQAFDKAAGIMLEVNPGSPAPLVVKATDLDVYSMEWVDVLEAEGDPCKWRLPSRLLALTCGSLPIGSGRTVMLESIEHGFQRQVHLKSGRTTCKMNTLDPEYYPPWTAFDPASLSQAQDLGARISQISWATAKADKPLDGVCLTGDMAISTDKYRMARVPLEVPGIEDRIVIPITSLSAILKQTGEVSVGFEGSQMLIMPDEHSQIRVMLYGLEFPGLNKVFDRVYPESLKVRKEPLLAIMSRAVNFAGADRVPVLQCFIGSEEFAVMLSNDETGLLGDVVEIPGEAKHKRYKVLFTPKNIMDALQNAPSEEVTIYYDPDNARVPMKIDGGSGYEAWVMPRAHVETGG